MLSQLIHRNMGHSHLRKKQIKKNQNLKSLFNLKLAKNTNYNYLIILLSESRNQF